MTTEKIIVSETYGNFNKSFRFHGGLFKRWQQKMLFFLTTEKAANVLKEDIHVMSESSIPIRQNNNGKSPMNSYMFDPAQKEKHVEKVNQTAIDIALWKYNQFIHL